MVTRDEMSELGAKLDAVQKEHQRIRIEVTSMIHEALADGWSKKAIADYLGLSRQTIYNVLGSSE